jgi:hypothetical protein
MNFQRIIKPRRLVIFHITTFHNEHRAIIFHHAGMIGISATQHLGTRAFHEAQIIRVIHHAAGISVFKIDAEREGVR